MIRITSGIYKGRRLTMPAGIRPTRELVRKAVFDILGDVAGLSFLELFAGSGAVGLEALSRGAGEVAFVESDRRCVAAIKKNLALLGVTECGLYTKEAEQTIGFLHKAGRRFDIIFLDPPYHLELPKKTLQTLGAYDILAPAGLIIAQHFKKDEVPREAGSLAVFKQSKYGDTFLSFYRKSAPPAAAQGGMDVPAGDLPRDL